MTLCIFCVIWKVQPLDHFIGSDMPRSGESMGMDGSGKTLAYWHIIATSLYINMELLTASDCSSQQIPRNTGSYKDYQQLCQGKKKKVFEWLWYEILLFGSRKNEALILETSFLFYSDKMNKADSSLGIWLNCYWNHPFRLADTDKGTAWDLWSDGPRFSADAWKASAVLHSAPKKCPFWH